MADFERDVILSVARHLDHERLDVAHGYTKATLRDWYPESLSSANLDKIRADGIGDTGDHDSIFGAMYRVGTQSFKAQRLLQYPTVVLCVGMWWVLHPECRWDHPAKMHYDLDDAYHDYAPPRLAERVLELVNSLFAEYTPAHDLLTPHLTAGYAREDHMNLMGGALWSAAHGVAWTGSLLYVQEHPDALVEDRFWSWPLDLTAQILGALREEYLVGLPPDHPFWEARRGYLRYVRRVREDEQGMEDGGQGDSEA